jgi:hypothetical protein
MKSSVSESPDSLEAYVVYKRKHINVGFPLTAMPAIKYEVRSSECIDDK